MIFLLTSLFIFLILEKIVSMSDESFSCLFSEFVDLYHKTKFTITQKYLVGMFTIKTFSRKEDSNFSISFVLTFLENLQQKHGIINNWSPFYLRIFSLDNRIVCHKFCAKNPNEIEFYKKQKV